jgi:hypothetical protein
LDPTVCKTVGSAYVGSNPTPATSFFPDIVGKNLALPVGTEPQSERSAAPLRRLAGGVGRGTFAVNIQGKVG